MGERDAVLVSSLPLATGEGARRRAIDLGLHADGSGYRSRNALADVWFAGRASNGMRFARSGLRVRPAAAAAVEATVSDDRLVFASVQTDTDFVTLPTRTGAQVLWQLRSSLSPEHKSA